MAESLPITSAAVHQKAESQPPERQRAQERRSFWWGHRAYWWCQLVVWTGNMGVSIWGGMLAPAKHVDGALHPVLLAFFFSTLTTVLTHVYRWVILSGHWKECGFPRLIPRVVVACLGCGMILAGLSWKVDHHSWEAENMGWGMAALLTVWLSVHFLAWSAAYFSWHYYGQLQEARLQKLRLDMSVKEAALASLRSQVNPHFLFNGLNTLRSLIDTDPARARMMVTHLAKIFRASLASGSTQLVPVQQELETVDAYLLIEKMRFEEKLEVSSQVQPGVVDALLPPFLLQTLVENAVKYGSPDPGGVRRVAYEVQNTPQGLTLRVENLGRLHQTSHSTGMGLKMARERLALLYDGRASLDLHDSGNGQVVAQAVVPQT